MGCRRLKYYPDLSELKVVGSKKELTLKNTAQTSQSKNLYRYVGKEKDLESGLYYYGARYYAAWTCRFVSVDPLAADYPFYTPYNYAGNKPINKVDIDGLQEEGNSGNSMVGDSGAKPSPNAQEANIDPSHSMANTPEGFGYADSFRSVATSGGDIPTSASEGGGTDSGPQLGETYPMRTRSESGEDQISLVLQTEVQRNSEGTAVVNGGPVVATIETPQGASVEINNGVAAVELSTDIVEFSHESPVIDRNKTDVEELDQNLGGIVQSLQDNPNMSVVLEGTTGSVWPQDSQTPSANDASTMRNVQVQTSYYNRQHLPQGATPTDVGSGSSRELGSARAATIKNRMVQLGASPEQISTTSNSNPASNTSRSVFMHISF